LLGEEPGCVEVIVVPADVSWNLLDELCQTKLGIVGSSLLLSARTIKESNSGNHLGHAKGHAAVKVERNKNIIEYNCRFREVRIVCIFCVYNPSNPSIFLQVAQNFLYLQKYMCAESSKVLNRNLVGDNRVRCE